MRVAAFVVGLVLWAASASAQPAADQTFRLLLGSAVVAQGMDLGITVH